jgi:starch synthase
MRIAHISAEVTPFAKTGGLGDVVGALPAYQAALGHEVSIWMPYYRQVRQWLAKKGLAPEWVCDPIRIELGYQAYEVGIGRTKLPGSEVPVYLVAHEPFFDRDQVYAGFYGRDDGYKRYPVFVRAALEAMRRLKLVPDVLHAHDWHTALAPMAVSWDRPRDWHFEKTATALTIHNAAYQGMYAPDTFIHLGLPTGAFSEAGVTWGGAVNLLKGGILAADAVTAVSPNFAQEITTIDGGFGIDPVLRFRGRDLVGIVNGIDSKVWNPAADTLIPQTYDAATIEKKLENRRALLVRAGMDPDDRGFVVGIVSRLTSQKGLDMLFPVLGELLGDGVRFVMLGSGDPELERTMHTVSHYAQKRFWAYVGYSEELAHLIEAGADAFLMPSRFEPCGLNQLYSLAYGTPPIVRRVGGLADTVVPYDGRNLKHATGFGFDAASPEALRETVRWAHRGYRDPVVWTRLVKNGMAQDFGWTRSAEKYLALYGRILARKRRT